MKLNVDILTFAVRWLWNKSDIRHEMALYWLLKRCWCWFLYWVCWKVGVQSSISICMDKRLKYWTGLFNNLRLSGIDQFRFPKIQPELIDLMQYEALRNNCRVCRVSSPGPRIEVCCVGLNFIISKLSSLISVLLFFGEAFCFMVYSSV